MCGCCPRRCRRARQGCARHGPVASRGMADEPVADAAAGDVRDALPEDLDVSGFVGPYQFPDNSRRRYPGIIYLVIAAMCLIVWIARGGDDAVLVNNGFVVAAVLLTAAGLISLTSGWRMHVDEKDAL